MKLFGVHHQQKELAIINLQPKMNKYKSITQPLYQPCLFLALAVLDRANFRDMLIFARVRYFVFMLLTQSVTFKFRKKTIILVEMTAKKALFLKYLF